MFEQTWSSEDIQALMDMWNSRGEVGVMAFDKQAAEILHVTPGAIEHKRRKLGLSIKKKKIDETNTNDISSTVCTGPIGDDVTIPKQEALEKISKEVFERIEAEKERLQNAAFRKALKDTIEEKITIDVITEAISKSLTRIQPPTITPYIPNVSKKSEEMLVVISDCQIGSKTDQDYVDGISRFDTGTFLVRLERFKNAVCKLVSERQSIANLDTMRILLLGDIIDGMDIFNSQAYELDISVIDQVTTAFQSISSVISYWSTKVPKITVHALPGNHGSLGRDANPRDNWEFLIYKLMESQLKGHSNISFEITRAPFLTTEFLGWQFLLTHGDEIKGRLPAAGAMKAEGEWRGVLKGKDFDYFIFGHHHRHMQIETNRGELLCNGCWPGGSNYSIGKLQLISRPSQLVLGLTKEEGISYRYKVDLERFPV